MMYYVGLLPAVISALIACQLSMCFGLEPLHFSIAIPDISFLLLAKLLLLVVVCAVISIVFCVAVHKTHAFADRVFHNIFVQVVLGGIVIVVLSVLLGTSDYNGLGMHVIEQAMQGQAAPFSWGWKLIFTAITIGFGYKGGEIVPVLFVGATLGCVMGQLLGMEPGLGAAVGMIALFCGVTNCPLASIVMSVELFGSAGLALFACTAAVSYLFSGYYGLYGSQHINYSKLRAEFINRSAD